MTRRHTTHTSLFFSSILVLALAAWAAAPALARERPPEPRAPEPAPPEGAFALGDEASGEPGEIPYPVEALDVADEEPVDPFARIRYEDGALTVLRASGVTAELGFNEPIFAGDTVKTDEGQRGEVQFPDGSLVRLGRYTELEVYDVGAPAGRLTDATLLGLARGSLQADVPDARGGDGFRIDTPNASIYPLEPTSFRVDVDDDGEVRVSVISGAVEVVGEGGAEILDSGWRTRVNAGRAPQRPYRYNVMMRDGFDRWVAQRDDVYQLRGQPGPEYADLPDEVLPYYGELSRHGSWVYDDDWGWVWSPRVDKGWRPYVYGHWADGPVGPVWVSVESWGWPVYRYGRWDYHVGYGWVWLPGRIFRPAHVSWYYGPSYVGWCPIGYWNRPVYVGPHVSFSIGVSFGHAYFDYHPWHFVHYDHFFWHRAHKVYVPRSRVLPGHLGRGYVTRRDVIRRAAREGAVAHRGRVGVGRVERQLVRGDAIYSRAGEVLEGRGRSLTRGSRDASLGRGARAAAARSGQSFRERETEIVRSRSVATRGIRGPAIGGRDGTNRPSREVGTRSRGSRAESRGEGRSSRAERGSSSRGSRGSRGSATGSRGSSSGGSRGSRGGSTRGRDPAPTLAPVASAPAERPTIRIRRGGDGDDAANRRGTATRSFPRSATPSSRSSAGRAARGDGERRAGDDAARGARGLRGSAPSARSGWSRSRRSDDDGVRRFFGRIGEESRRIQRPRSETSRGSASRSSASRSSASEARAGRSTPRGTRPSAGARSTGDSRSRAGASRGSSPRTSVGSRSSRGSSRPSVGSRSSRGSSSREGVGSRSSRGSSRSSVGSRSSRGSSSQPKARGSRGSSSQPKARGGSRGSSSSRPKARGGSSGSSSRPKARGGSRGSSSRPKARGGSRGSSGGSRGSRGSSRGSSSRGSSRRGR